MNKLFSWFVRGLDWIIFNIISNSEFRRQGVEGVDVFWAKGEGGGGFRGKGRLWVKTIPPGQAGYPGKDIFTLSVSNFVTAPFPVEGWSGRDEGGRKSEFNIFTGDFRLKSKQPPVQQHTYQLVD